MTELKKELIKRIGLFGVTVLLSSLFFVPAAQGLTLIPPSLEISLIPGQTSNTIIKLYNETQDTLQLYTEARSFTAKGETGQPDFDFEAEPIGLSEWIEVEKGPIVLEPGERVEIPVTINPPSDADPGGHYATVFFSSNPPDEGQVRISSKLGTLLLGRVAGDIIEDGLIAGFGLVEGKAMFNRLPIEFFARFQNTGNVHLRPTGAIAINSMFGKETGTVDVNAGKGATLPQTIRKYEAVWEKGQVRGVQGNFFTRFWDEYANERNNFGFGKYTANLSLHAGTNSIDDTATVSFWVMPWRVILVWGVVAVFGIIFLIILLKRYNAWIRKKAEK